MYAAYHLDVNDRDSSILDDFQTTYANDEKIDKIFQNLADQINKKGLLKMNDIATDWFPEIDTHVFISHSHADEDKACQLANFLAQFGIKSFIDSKFWGYSTDLLKSIDNKYCLNNDGYYNYNLRNQSTAHVHMLLATALAKMIDKCECLLFLDTENSNYENEDGELCTNSTWINLELYLTSIIRVKKPETSSVLMDSIESYAEEYTRYIPTEYHIDLSHLTKINMKNLLDLQYIVACSNKNLTRRFLDRLYDKYRPNQPNKAEW